MASGIAIDDVCRELFAQFNTGGKVYRCITFRVSANNKAVVAEEEIFQIKKDTSIDAKDDTKNALKTICKLLIEGDAASNASPRWIVFNFEFVTDDGRDTDKSIFIKWCPESAKVKARMVFTTSTKGLVDDIKISATAVQADSIEEIQEILPKLQNGQLK